MKRWIANAAWMLLAAACVLLAVVLLVAALAGCAAKKPVNYRFSACQVSRTWIDEQGRERKDCDCKNGREIGFDAKTRLRIIRCE